MTLIEVKCPSCKGDALCRTSLLTGTVWIVCQNEECKAMYELVKVVPREKPVYRIQVENLKAADRLMDFIVSQNDMDVIV